MKDEDPQIDLIEHLLPLADLMAKCAVEVNPKKPTASPGLSSQEAASRLLKYGPNCLSPPKKKHVILQFLDHLLGLFNVMLLVSGIACYVLYGIDPLENASNVRKWTCAKGINAAFYN